MKLMLKTLGLGLATALTAGAVGLSSASATISGHFVHDSVDHHAILTGSGNGDHGVIFEVDGGTPILCESETSHGTVSTATTTLLTLTPTTTGCHTEGGAAGSVTVDMNGCSYAYHSNSAASASPYSAHATFTSKCIAGKNIEITHPNCVIRIPPQTRTGLIYTRISSPKHELTIDKTITGLEVQYESGICIFLGTKHSASLTGSTTIRATTTAGEQVNLTAT